MQALLCEAATEFSNIQIIYISQKGDFFHTFKMCGEMQVGLTVKRLSSDFKQSWKMPHFHKNSHYKISRKPCS
jgi:hypothetical protein